MSKIPKLQFYVNDFSGVLIGEQQKELNELFSTLDIQSSLQAVTVIFPHRDGKELRDIALEVFNIAEIGQKGKNNGLLLIIASEEKKIRIMTGKGLEFLYNDAWCSNIIEKKLRPLLEKEDYAELIKTWNREIKNKQEGKKEESLLPTKSILLVIFLGGSILAFFHALSFFILAIIWLISMGILLLKHKKYRVELGVLLIFGLVFFSIAGAIQETNRYCKENPTLCEISVDSESGYKSSPSPSHQSNYNFSSSSSSSSSFGGGGGSSNGGGSGD